MGKLLHKHKSDNIHYLKTENSLARGARASEVVDKINFRIWVLRKRNLRINS